MTEAMTPGWATYLRVSDEDKQSPERSFAMQRKQIQDRLLESSNIDFYQEYQDRLTGTTSNRAQYQKMLRDAENGRFSHLGLYRADRFGRDTVEGLITAKKLIDLGVKIRVANMPSLRPEDPDGILMFQLMMGLAQREVDVMRQRTRDGTEAKLRAGGWPNRAPEGYQNRERQIKSGKYERWVEIDPIYSPGIRKAWDLLLTDRYTIRQICDELTKLGFIRSSGRPWAWYDPNTGKRRYARTTLHHIFKNPFYAGWVVSDSFNIRYGEVRGNWKPIVSSREFEKGISILTRHRKQKSRPKKKFYLLRNLLWVEVENGKTYKMYGSTPSGRSKSYFYYVTHAKPNGKQIRIPGEEINQQIPNWLQGICINSSLIPSIQTIYEEQIKSNNSKTQKETIEHLENKISRLKQEEERLGRLYIKGGISEKAYKKIRSEWWENIQNARVRLESCQKKTSIKIDDLDLALLLLTQVSDLYPRLEKDDKVLLLRTLIEKLIVDEKGEINDQVLKSPFLYLIKIADTVIYDELEKVSYDLSINIIANLGNKVFLNNIVRR